MKLAEVTSPQQAKEFIGFQPRLYKHDKNYIRPLDKDVEAVFDQKKNRLFRDGECIRWLLLDDNKKTIGRVAAFINRKHAKEYEQPTGCIGFFDCIEDEKAAFMLFDACKGWLQQRGMEAMDGPINFGDRDKFWGLLVDNFSPPGYGMNYNFPYYQRLFESYGFRDYYKQYTYYRLVDDKLTPEYHEKAQRILKDFNYSFEHLKLKELEKYTEHFRVVYNKAWVRHTGVKEMTLQQAKLIMNTIRPVIDEKLIWFAYYSGEPVAFFIGLPEMNTIFRYVNGKLDWWGKLKFFWYYKIRKVCKTMYGIVFGVVPDHQRKGLETALIVSAGKIIQNRKITHYDDFVMNWIGDFNPKMMAVAEQVGGRIYKTHITYRYLFDRTKEFVRAKVL